MTTLHHGDCLEVLRGMPDNSIDSIVTDPPYGLSDHKPADVVACMTAWLAGEPYLTNKRGFMGKTWDSWVPGPEVWRECLRVLKPGGHVLAFAGSRTHDLMSMAMRLAGFECRDTIMYLYGSGFPKSLDVSKAIDKMAGAEREVVGLKRYGDGQTYQGGESAARTGGGIMGEAAARGPSVETAPATDAARQWQGWGTSLKPAFEPVLMFRKPLAGTVAENVLAHGTGGLNIDGCKVGGDAGRWPANLIHDGSDEVLAGFPQTAPSKSGGKAGPIGYHAGGNGADRGGHDDNGGSAARFFYCAKASKRDRGEGNTHPTVKPTDLMAYLCRLVTPPGGVVLDPFMGSGSTGKAAVLEGFRFIGIEREAEYLAIAQARIKHASQDGRLL